MDSKIRIIIDQAIPFIEGVLEPYADVIYKEGRAISREDAMNADALIIRTRTKCDASLLEGTPVKFIATATIGMDHIDLPYCNEKGIVSQLDGAEVVVERRPVRNLGKVDRAARAREGRRAAAFPVGTRAKVVVRPTDPLEIGCTDALGKQQAEDNSSSRHRRANMSQHYLIFVE